MLARAKRAKGCAACYCHMLLDGRDVPATSALDYVAQLEAVPGRAPTATI
jgi:bisphosphoglycerate-independent phosphoglycerate mutase (AlkP superfamily)